MKRAPKIHSRERKRNDPKGAEEYCWEITNTSDGAVMLQPIGFHCVLFWI
jgi:hypothetical protein